MTRAIRTLLGSLIDYAGLFPPAGLDMRAAVANYAAYRAGEFAWMLDRFVAPVARLEEFESVVQQHAPTARPDDDVWRLSVLAGTNLTSDFAAMADFNRRQVSAASGDDGPAAFVIDTIELKATNAVEIRHAMRLMPAGLRAYFEVPVSSDPSLLAAARSVGARVKVRTGGVTPEAFPTSSELAGFLARCVSVRVPFKATAGLHHAIRSEHRLTYADDSPRGTMHGFLNVFLAAAGLRAGMTVEEAQQLLEETSPRAIQFDEHVVTWRRYEWTRDALNATRQEFAISFGSCSFQEPIDDLKAMRLL